MIEEQIVTRLTETSVIDDYQSTALQSPFHTSVISSIPGPKKPLTFFRQRKANTSFEIPEKSTGFNMMEKVIFALKKKVKSSLTKELQYQNQLNHGIKCWLAHLGDMDNPDVKNIGEDLRGKLA
jgi:hypothetical protein